ncbi:MULTISPECIES: hypothetical protein [Calothrix]|uniref:Uncharacterized protein n=2 Tax=Calothrix TaxID=1186 RepID=A0ABR8A3A6_9CYAN|nr:MULTISPECIES: hypothetical protein [Calothrix]MBD2194371.1 hypothetical protein [Calothrix parietina FACHB-288]MBD2223153.1 hypothetical protein [Calothrix anomala FACHB-343]
MQKTRFMENGGNLYNLDEDRRTQKKPRIFASPGKSQSKKFLSLITSSRKIKV